MNVHSPMASTYYAAPVARQPSHYTSYGGDAAYGLASYPYRPAAPRAQSELGLSELSNHHAHHHHDLARPPHYNHSPEAAQPHIPQPGMAYSGSVHSDGELDEFQKLSNNYEPESTGPLVGDRQSSNVLATEYSAADPVYQAKTAALPQKYSHYRTCRGDGRCGWRAIAFGYFESLLALESKGKFLEEETRIRSLGNLMTIAGFESYVWEDFAAETHTLLRRCMALVGNLAAQSTLLEAFNDDGLQNSIITHLRILSAAWMKTHAEDYAPFVLPYTVEEYCNGVITPFSQEIDHPGIAALTDILLKPAGVALDVIYLDRSEGTEVNAHEFAPGVSASCKINLLYRPGHYDILYERGSHTPHPQTAHSVSAPTYLQYDSQFEEPIMGVGVPDVMNMIPGMSLVSGPASWMSGAFYGAAPAPPAPVEFSAPPPPLPVQHHAPTHPQAASPSYMPPTQHHPIHAASSPTSHMQVTRSHEFGFVSDLPQENVFRHDLLSFAQGSNFRASQHMYNQEIAASAQRNIDFQTSQFKNSHFNPAHFLNPDFHPEEWDPRNDYEIPGSSSITSASKGKQKSSS